MYNVIEVTNENYGRLVSLFKNYRTYILVKHVSPTIKYWDGEQMAIHVDDIVELLDVRHLDDPVNIKLVSDNYRKKIFVDTTDTGVCDEYSGWVIPVSSVSFDDYETARLFLETY